MRSSRPVVDAIERLVVSRPPTYSANETKRVAARKVSGSASASQASFAGQNEG